MPETKTALKLGASTWVPVSALGVIAALMIWGYDGFKAPLLQVQANVKSMRTDISEIKRQVINNHVQLREKVDQLIRDVAGMEAEVGMLKIQVSELRKK